MRAYQLLKYGAGIEALVKVDRPDPKPAYRQVLVKIAACSLNFRDLGARHVPHTCSRQYYPAIRWCRGSCRCRPGVKRIKVGDRVAGCFFQRWSAGEPNPDVHSSALGGGIDGMLAEYAVLEEDEVVKLPKHLSFEEGATLPCAAVTVWYALVEHGKVIAGQTVLLQGTGGLSIFGLQFAHAMGVQTVVTSSSDVKLARAKSLGANYTINYKTVADWDKAAKGFTGGRGVDQVIEVGGAGTLTRSFGSIRVGGKISLIGGLSGPATELNPGLILARRANVQGISVGSTQTFETMNRAIATNAIKPVVDKVFGFNEVHAAYRHMASGLHFGKIAIQTA